MAATRGQWIQDRYLGDIMQHQLLCRLDREAGDKRRRSQAIRFAEAET